MNVKISIIIPVYNVEDYLRKCLDSCIRQTFKSIEIILIDDCSIDNSPQIMKEYEHKYPNLVKCVFLKENIKQGGARNEGVALAKGEYILFVDADDYIAENMCEKLYSSAILNNADIVMCDYIRINENRFAYRKTFDRDVESKFNISHVELLNYRPVSGFACNKLCKKNIVEKYKFRSNVFYEDVEIVLVWLLKAQKINYVSEGLYYYVQRSDSTVSIYDKDIELQYGLSIIQLLDNLKKYQLLNAYYDQIVKYVLQELVIWLNRYTMRYIENHSIQIENIAKYLVENLPDIENKLDFLEYYEKEMIFNLIKHNNYLIKIYNKSLELLPKMFSENNIAIWGAGVFGKYLIEYLDKYNVKPRGIIDGNKKLEETYLNNILITTFDKVKYKYDIIIVSVKHYKVYQEIKEKILKENPQIKVMYFSELFKI